MVDGPIDRPENWRTMALAFTIWAVHFSAAYAGELIFPNEMAARWVAAGATLAALAALAWVWWGREARSTLGDLAVALATAGVIYDAMPALLVW